MPKVSVLMSVYNDAPYLGAAIESILNQSFSDFEFIIIDDGSTDPSPQVLDRYADPRIIRLSNSQNIGLTRSLNRGLAVANGAYLARIDANDLALTDRLARQVAYLDEHPEIGLLSGDMISMDAEGHIWPEQPSDYARYASHDYLRWALLWRNPIAHITVMLRMSVLQEHQISYKPEFNRAEDYELWATLSRYTRLVRLPEAYVYRRVLPTGVSFTLREKQLAIMAQVAAREFAQVAGEELALEGAQTLFDLLHRDSDYERKFTSGTNLLYKTYNDTKSHNLSAEDRHLIRGEAVGYLLKLSQRARVHGRSAALYPLWVLRRVSAREFYSLAMLKRILTFQ